MNPISRDWFVTAFDWRAILTPFAKVRRCVTHEAKGYHFIYHDYYVFGFRIARIHQ